LQSIRKFQQGGIGNIFAAYALVTSPGLWSTAAGTGGPLLWNPPGSGVNAYLQTVLYGNSVADTVAGALGITGNTGQTAAPGTTTAVDSVGNCYIGGSAPKCTAYRIGTPTNAGGFFFPIGMVHTGALTVDTTDDNAVDLGGVVVVPPGCWAAVAASAILTSVVMQIGLIWLEG
jgi:hypothetical protein